MTLPQQLVSLMGTIIPSFNKPISNHKEYPIWARHKIEAITTSDKGKNLDTYG